jgi:hypothetical protein
MMRKVQLRENSIVTACPQCGNNTVFTAHSERCMEDCCNVWVECKCGYDPTAENTGLRFEDVWGGTDNNRVRVALDCWNEAIAA